MRHYVPQKNNPFVLSHDLYMQMLYLIRDCYHCMENKETEVSRERVWQWEAVKRVAVYLKKQYKKRPGSLGAFDALRGFFDYAYYSYMFTGKGSDMGAGKRSWNLYRCRFAYLVAAELGLVTGACENRPGQ